MHCPNCNGTNIQFKRENHGEVREKDSKRIIHKTIGLCKDCGATWEVVYEKPKKPKKSKKPLTEKQKKRRKIFWGIFIILCLLITIVSCSPKDNGVDDQLSFVLMDGEIGDYGIEVVLNENTEFEEHEIAYYIPAGTYLVENLNTKNAGQVTVYSGLPELDGEWEYFVADSNCAAPIVVMPGESKELEIKEGQFIVLSDDTSNFQFTLQKNIAETENSSTEDIIIEEDNDSEEDVFSTWTAEQRYAFTSGLTYLEVMAFSRQGLIDQLSSEYGENYPLEVAEFAVNAIEEQGLVDWDAECEEAAQTYLSLMSFSKQGLIDQLSSEYGEQFTVEQAERAVEKVYK